MNILLIDNGTKHLRKLKELLVRHKVDTYPLSATYPDPKNYDLIILSGGSKFSVFKKPSLFSNEIQLVRASPTPIIGICEGCEIIARSFHSHVRFSFPKFKGIKKINVINKSILNLPSQITVWDAHYWAIKTLGPELTGIAISKRGYEIIKHNKKPIYGLMFHPEMLVDKSLGDEIFRKIVSLVQ